MILIKIILLFIKMYKNPTNYNRMNKYSNSKPYCSNLAPPRATRPRYPCHPKPTGTKPIVEHFNPLDCANNFDQGSCEYDVTTNQRRQGTCSTCNTVDGILYDPFGAPTDNQSENDACQSAGNKLHPCQWDPNQQVCGCDPLIEPFYYRPDSRRCC
jgi:hypothetical protein